MSDFLDVSMPIHDGMAHWPTDPSVTIQSFKSPEKGDRSVVSVLRLGSHTGTHVDAPKHFLPGGTGVDSIPLDHLIGPCHVIDCRGRTELAGDVLSGLPAETPLRVLFRTNNSDRLLNGKFFEDFVALSADAADGLVQRGAVLVGVDGFSIDPFRAPTPAAHLMLLRAGVAIIEGLFLKDVPPGRYDLICLPWRLQNADGAPARVVLRRLI